MTRKSPETVAFLAGSFNPFTRGHQSLVERGLMLFDRVVIGIGINAVKSEADAAALRARLDGIRELYRDEPRVTVLSYSTLTVTAAAAAGATVLLRGARTGSEFEAEVQMADANRHLSHGTLETVILPTRPELSWVSSSLVRDLRSHEQDVTDLLP